MKCVPTCTSTNMSNVDIISISSCTQWHRSIPRKRRTSYFSFRLCLELGNRPLQTSTSPRQETTTHRVTELKPSSPVAGRSATQQSLHAMGYSGMWLHLNPSQPRSEPNLQSGIRSHHVMFPRNPLFPSLKFSGMAELGFAETAPWPALVGPLADPGNGRHPGQVLACRDTLGTESLVVLEVDRAGKWSSKTLSALIVEGRTQAGGHGVGMQSNSPYSSRY